MHKLQSFQYTTYIYQSICNIVLVFDAQTNPCTAIQIWKHESKDDTVTAVAVLQTVKESILQLKINITSYLLDLILTYI